MIRHKVRVDTPPLASSRLVERAQRRVEGARVDALLGRPTHCLITYLYSTAARSSRATHITERQWNKACRDQEAGMTSSQRFHEKLR